MRTGSMVPRDLEIRSSCARQHKRDGCLHGVFEVIISTVVYHRKLNMCFEMRKVAEGMGIFAFLKVRVRFSLKISLWYEVMRRGVYILSTLTRFRNTNMKVPRMATEETGKKTKRSKWACVIKP